jgi:hypothetical protein
MSVTDAEKWRAEFYESLRDYRKENGEKPAMVVLTQDRFEQFGFPELYRPTISQEGRVVQDGMLVGIPFKIVRWCGHSGYSLLSRAKDRQFSRLRRDLSDKNYIKACKKAERVGK